MAVPRNRLGVLVGPGAAAVLGAGLSASLAQWVGLWTCLALLLQYGLARRGGGSKALPGDQGPLDHLDAPRARLDLLVNGVSRNVRGELAAMSAEVDRFRRLVSEAVQSLGGSFTNLNQCVARQHQLMTHDLNQGGESHDLDAAQGSFASFAAEIDVTLQGFVDDTQKVSGDSILMVHSLDDLATEMSAIEGLVETVQGIADETNLLALNADIEAARAGDAGRAFGVVANEVRNLSRNSRQFAEEIVQVVSRATANIEAARERMGSMASRDMTTAIRAKDRLDTLLQGHAAASETAEAEIRQVAELSREIDSTVGEAVRGLQFEDMVQQIAQHLGRRILLLDTFVNSLQDGDESLLSGYRGNPERFEARMAEVLEMLEEQEALFSEVRHNAVEQESMAEGEIVLF